MERSSSTTRIFDCGGIWRYYTPQSLSTPQNPWLGACSIGPLGPISQYGYSRRPYTKYVIRFVISLVAAVAVALWPAIVFSQNESGQLTIVVVDASDAKPVALARVLLDGPIMTNELTTQSGKVIFSDVPAGVYTARVGKSGYQTITTAAFEVVDGKAVEVNVQLAAAASGVKSLGTITVKSSAGISSTAILQDSAIRKLSPTLNDALNKLSGVSVGADSASDDAAQTISLEGHDPSQTQVALDGIPLNAPGTASDLRFISSDFFAGASVSFNPVAGALGGSVNYRTLEPTRSWQLGINAPFGQQTMGSTRGVALSAHLPSRDGRCRCSDGFHARNLDARLEQHLQQIWL